MSKYGHLSHNFFEGLLNKMGGEERAQAFLRGELVLVDAPRKWRVDADGVIYFSVESDGTTGEEWIKRLEKKGSKIEGHAKEVLRSPEFKPTSGVTTEVAVLPGMLFKNDERTIKKVRALAIERKLTSPNAEVTCSICEMFSNKEIKAMGLWWIVVMHESINVPRGARRLLGARLNNASQSRSLDLDTDPAIPNCGWDHVTGFAFAVSQSTNYGDTRGIGP